MIYSSSVLSTCFDAAFPAPAAALPLSAREVAELYHTNLSLSLDDEAELALPLPSLWACPLSGWKA